MYRQGIPTSKIAAAAGVAATTVRYHLQIAARAEPGIREEHKAALPAVAPQPNQVGLRNLADRIAFHQAHGRLPSSHGKSARERALESCWQTAVGKRQKEPSPPPTVKAWPSSQTGTKHPGARPMTKPGGSSVWMNCGGSGLPAATGPGTRKRTTWTNGCWAFGCMDSGSNTAPADWILPGRRS